ncbi:glycosyl hydrolases family 2, sugar binding domain [Anaerolinea thermolimosa]|uniref:glycosyl hydrolase n=1 Tax=Anaerolinea thermolimosa TaxID=229919 RepID=UPI0007867C06|nr:glycosyl hydrolase [Anaerolinea thermolimosa]GAP06626.1 glycosyl hydrolases family 2, sugar binding domain [Anaerolinea thermolimosa]
MKTRLDEVLEGCEANYLLPFIWQRGEGEAVIREEMERIHQAGIGAVCVEARPHPDFLGKRWWHDFDVILEEARKRHMRVWVLDDDHFPTGHAAGIVVNAQPSQKRLFLYEHHLDVLGPQRHSSFLVKPFLMELFQPPGAPPETNLLAVIAVRRDVETGLLTGPFVEITSNIQEDILYWDIPEGYWRIFFLFTSPTGGSEPHKDYINPLVPESVKILIDTVYEPFYQRYAGDFGGTFAGFFSDEPGFYNDRDTFDYQSKPGKKGIALPWRSDLLTLLEAEAGCDFKSYLPLLWFDGGEQTGAIRFSYMNLVSKLYAEHFTRQIGEWCRNHGVEYIGHVLEDNGSHAHLGCGPGHYFRALWGQDMAGLDVVLWQLLPGFDHGIFNSVAGEADGEFYHYGLAKMGSSLGHIDPKKQGRTMCELFGAYGWREGLKLMKWMADHLLVRGVNYFVPHAFSQANFPDPDCPPHFYARGMNPQYRYLHLLSHYINRVSHLLSGGVHIAPVAVLYHAEAEWAGTAMPFQTPVRLLMQHQIDCDVIPGDILLHGAEVVQGNLKIHQEAYQVLIIPQCSSLPEHLIHRIIELADSGLKVIFIDNPPGLSLQGTRANPISLGFAGHAHLLTTSLDQLISTVRPLISQDILAGEEQPYLRYYHVRHNASHVYFLTNEHPGIPIKTCLKIRNRGPALFYDAFTNQIHPLAYEEIDDTMEFPLDLPPYNGVVIVTGDLCKPYHEHLGQPTSLAEAGGLQEIPIPGPWKISIATAKEYPNFRRYQDACELMDLSCPAALPTFSGTIRYETTFEIEPFHLPAELDFGEAFETVEVWLNGQHIGTRICPPYRWNVTGLIHSGDNHLRVDVTNTLVKEQRDFFSCFTYQEPSGLLGPVRLLVRTPAEK